MALLALGGAFLAAPASADTKGDLDAARRELQAKQAQLNAVALRWQEAETKYAQTQDAIRRSEITIANLQARLTKLRQQLADQVRAVYISGGNATWGALLSSETMSDFADRLQFATSIAQGDVDLATTVQVQTVQLQRERQRLTEQSKTQAATVASLAAQKQEIDASVSDLQQTVARLQDEFKRQQQALLGLPVSVGASGTYPVDASGAIQTCPVQGPVAFVDSFGWPRPGGRIHEGIDMIAPYGTPIVAVHDGNAVQAPNALGGNAVILYHDGSADWSYYAHMSSYGASGHVSAGQVIGYVGSTGDTSVNHCHFEFHPGGGAAVDTYQILLAVC